VRVVIPWRRRDNAPDDKNVIVVDASTDERIANVLVRAVTGESGELVFQPKTAPGTYHVYYLPFRGSLQSYYPKIEYQQPEATADAGWLACVSGDMPIASADCVELQAIEPFHAFGPMETIATRAEIADLLARHPDADYLVFPEDRDHAVRMFDHLPARWVERGPAGTFEATVGRGEFLVFQLGLYAARGPLQNISVTFSDASGSASRISADTFRCFNLGGTDWRGKHFSKQVSVPEGAVKPLWCGVLISSDLPPGIYDAAAVIRPANRAESRMELKLRVTGERIEAGGDDTPSRLSRLRWLDSTLGADDGVIAPYAPLAVSENTVRLLGRTVTLGPGGLPSRIESFFAPEVTHFADEGRLVLQAPIRFVAEDTDGDLHMLGAGDCTFTTLRPDRVAWRSENACAGLSVCIEGAIEPDGHLACSVAVTAPADVEFKDLYLDIPLRQAVTKYAMGLGLKGGYRPAAHDWKWDKAKNQDCLWVGDANAGLQVRLRDENYVRPLNTNFYQLQPLVMPRSWCNGGEGGIRCAETDDDTFLVRCYSGPRRMTAGETLHYDFDLLLTPFRPIDPAAHFGTRFYHAHKPVDDIVATGANTINIHHATDINPYINYPFLRPDEMKAYVAEAHARGCKVKVYYTVRELTTRAPEFFALLCLDGEIFSSGPGGGHPWLQEHVGEDYIAAWYAVSVRDTAVINTGQSRWHNFYVEGLDWLARNIGVDGIYIDDLAFDRTVMKRVRRVLDNRQEGALIDLHSANQFNPKDGFANSAGLYMEHFPYIDRLWFGEYFEYDRGPDYWLTEVSGIPFGLMGEMLQDGGNAWRGMLYGMTARMPGVDSVRHLWRAWNDLAIGERRMVGYWSPTCPARTNREDVPVTLYVGETSAVLALASWAPEEVAVGLDIDWDALGVDPEDAVLAAPEIPEFQEAAAFDIGGAIPVPPGKGWLLILGPPR
jgi:hypothetical protein